MPRESPMYNACMDCEIIDSALRIEHIPGEFREAIERRPAGAKMNRVEGFTPSIGPHLGLGGVVDRDHAIAAEVESPSSASSQTGVAHGEPDGEGCHTRPEVGFNPPLGIAREVADTMLFERCHRAEYLLAGLKASCEAVAAS